MKYAKRLWAKKSDQMGYRWLPLYQHLTDTQQIMGLLWEHFLSSGQKKLILGNLRSVNQDKLIDEDDAKRLAMFLGATHDLGKATPAFQMQKNPFCADDLSKRLWEELEAEGFVDFYLFADQIGLTNRKATHHSLAGEALLESFGVNAPIGSIVGAHHGKPVDDAKIPKKNLLSYDANYFQVEDPCSVIHEHWHDQQEAIFQWALSSSGYSSVDELPVIEQPAQVLLSGLLIMADWIASNETYFPLFPIDEISGTESRIQDGFTKWYADFSLWEPISLDVKTAYKDRFGFDVPRELQALVSQKVDEISTAGIVILEAPMGVGKTEVALLAAEQLAAKSGRSGIFFGLPTQATSDGIFTRVKSWLEAVVKSTGGHLSLRLMHGKAAQNPEFATLPKSSGVFEEEAEDERRNVRNGSGYIDLDAVVVNTWFAGRKVSMLDAFTVGTVDQFLLAALRQKHLALRHLGLSSKVVIIDEVHAYDAYMSVYLMEAVQWMGAYHVPVVILSATLPIERRNALVKNYLKGAGMRPKEIVYPEGYENNESYPLLTYTDIVRNTEDESSTLGVKQFSDFPYEPGTNYSVVLRGVIEELEISDLIESLLRGDGVIGVVVNTVRKAQKLAEICVERFGEEMVELLHSSFIASERLQKEQALMQMIGKNGKRPKKKIIIGTQVIEQSLDIDFDVMISDLAPMDLLIQRMGRLHRHKRMRPLTHQTPVLYVLGVDAYTFEDGTKAVYSEDLLFRTEYYLKRIIAEKQAINLPNDISPLVQNVYRDGFQVEVQSLDVNLQHRYQELEKHAKQEKEKSESDAKTYRLADPVVSRKNKKNKRLDGLAAWLKYPNQAAQSSEERGYAQVRDAMESIEVIALKQCGDGYAFFETPDTKIDIRDAKCSLEIAKHTIKLPSGMTKPYFIEECIKELEAYTLQHFPEWQHDSWLRGALGIAFDENNNFSLNKFQLHYDEKFGLQWEYIRKVE